MNLTLKRKGFIVSRNTCVREKGEEKKRKERVKEVRGREVKEETGRDAKERERERLL